MTTADYRIGFGRRPDGALILIGAGPEGWLRRRMPHGCAELITRDPHPGELDHEPAPERDLSGAGFR